MKIKNRRRMAAGLAALMFLSGLTACSANKNKEVEKTTHFSDEKLEPVTVKEVTVDSNTDILSDEYDSDFSKKTYYVHSNDKRKILSQQEIVEGYTLIGVYSSRSSADAIVFMVIDNGNGTNTYKCLSYDDLEKMENYDELELYVIDQYSPEELTGAFIPDASINKIVSTKTLR